MRYREVFSKFFAEFFATFILVLIGAGSVMNISSIGLTGVALAHGLALAIGVSMTMNISGGHVNPAVTIAMLYLRKIKPFLALGYIISQLLGSLFGAFLLSSMFPRNLSSAFHLGSPALARGVSITEGILIELVLTFILMLSVISTALDKRSPNIAGFGIGLTLAFSILVGGSLTGAALNPARALGPEVIANFFDAWYVYWIGPILGALIASMAYKYLIGIEERS